MECVCNEEGVGSAVSWHLSSLHNLLSSSFGVKGVQTVPLYLSKKELALHKLRGEIRFGFDTLTKCYSVEVGTQPALYLSPRDPKNHRN